MNDSDISQNYNSKYLELIDAWETKNYLKMCYFITKNYKNSIITIRNN